MNFTKIALLSAAVATTTASISLFAPVTRADDHGDFLRLHQAVRAHELCRNGGQAYSRDDQLKLAREIDRMAGGDLTAAERLGSVLQAGSSVSKMRHAGSCNGQKLNDLVELFESKLSPAL